MTPNQKNEALLSHKQLKELLHYESETGLFFWKVSRTSSIKVGDIAGSYVSNGYILINIGRTRYRAHRLAWFYVYGEWPNNQLDHKNQDKSDNRLLNLRECDHSLNSKNMPMRSDNKSGVTGVCWHKQNEKWSTEIKVNSKKIFLGCFNDIKDAVKIRKQAEILFGFHKNHGRSKAA